MNINFWTDQMTEVPDPIAGPEQIMILTFSDVVVPCVNISNDNCTVKFCTSITYYSKSIQGWLRPQRWYNFFFWSIPLHHISPPLYSSTLDRLTLHPRYKHYSLSFLQEMLLSNLTHGLFHFIVDFTFFLFHLTKWTFLSMLAVENMFHFGSIHPFPTLFWSCLL